MALDLTTGFNRASIGLSPRQDLSNQMSDQQTKKPWWTALISEIGGGAGLAAGAALAPETGGLSLLVPAIGAALGAGAGKAAETKIRDNKVNWKQVVGESALSGATSGLAEGYDAYKAGKAGTGLLDLANGATQAAEKPGFFGSIIPNLKQGIAGFGDLGIQAPEKAGLLESMGKNVKAGAMGFGQGARLNGERIGAGVSDSVGQTIKDLGISAGSPEAVQRQVENKLGSLGSILSNQYAKGNIALSTEEINNLGSSILGKVASAGGLNSDSANKFALDQVQKMVQKGDTNGLWDFVKELTSKSTNFAANPSSKMANEEAVARIMRSDIRDFLNAKVPGVADTNSLFHKVVDTNSLLKAAAADRSGGGAFSTIKNLSPVKALESKAGGALETAGKYTAGTGGPLTDVTRYLKLQAPSRLLGSTGQQNQSQSLMGAGQTPVDQNPSNLLQGIAPGQNVTSDLLGQTNGDPTSQLLGQQPQQAGGPSLDSLRQSIAEDIHKTGGKNISNLMQLAQLYGLVDNSGSIPGNKLTTDQQKTVDGANEASAQLDTMLAQLQQIGGGQGRISGILGGIEGKLGLNNQANAYNSTKYDTAIALSKAYTGSTRIPSGDSIKLIEQSLPLITDNPQEAQLKIDNIKQRLAAKIGSIPGGAQAGNISGSANLLSQLNGY